MCLLDQVSLSALWWVLGEYWMSVFGKVSLTVLCWVLGEYWMCVFGKVSVSALGGIGLVLHVCIG